MKTATKAKAAQGASKQTLSEYKEPVFSLTGTIKAIGEEEQITEKFKKREFVLLTQNPDYPQTIIFQLVNKNCEKLDKFDEGETVEVFFNLKGREYVTTSNEVRYFNTLEAWNIKK